MSTEVRFGPAVVNAEGAVLGRLASVLAKRLLMVEEITVVNAEKAIVSGNPKWLEAFYTHRRQRGDRKKGPFYPRYPERIFRRTVEGMLPENVRGRTAIKRLDVHLGTPPELHGKAEKAAPKQVEQMRSKYTTLGAIGKALGAKAERWQTA